MKTVIPVALLALPIITLAELAQVQVCSNFVTHAEFHFAKKFIYLSIPLRQFAARIFYKSQSSF